MNQTEGKTPPTRLFLSLLRLISCWKLDITPDSFHIGRD